MLTVNGVRMSKSAGNGFLPLELFSGNHPLLDKGYAPMAVRFFMMQSHYRSTLDFSNEALQASEKGYARLMTAMESLKHLPVAEKSSINVQQWEQDFYAAMDDDFNSPVLIAHLFDAVKGINNIKEGRDSISSSDLDHLKKLMQGFVYDVLGLQQEGTSDSGKDTLKKVMDLVIHLRAEARNRKDFAVSDQIRDRLTEAGIQLKDTKNGVEWQ
jgi:cysteinyl-tRNA synthetase